MRLGLGVGLTFPQRVGASAGGEPYHADAVQFDTDDVLSRDQPLVLDGAAAAPTGVISLWINTESAQVVFITSQDNGCLRLEIAGGDIILSLGDIDFSVYVYGILPWSSSDGGWHHLLWSWNTDFTAGNRVVQFYLDDVAQVVDTSDEDGGAFDVFYPDPGWTFSSSDDIAYSDVLFFPGGAFVDLTVEANRRKFIDVSGKPVDPAEAVAAFGNPAIMFSGNATEFVTNQGTGGAFVVTGAITDASTSPSD